MAPLRSQVAATLLGGEKLKVREMQIGKARAGMLTMEGKDGIMTVILGGATGVGITACATWLALVMALRLEQDFCK